MKTVLRLVGLAVTAVVLLGAGQFAGTRAALAQADVLDGTVRSDVPLRVEAYQRGGSSMPDYRDDLHAEIAAGLGMTLADFDAATAGGKSPWEIAQSKGFTKEQFDEVTFTAHENVLALAVNDGTLTQHEADTLLAWVTTFIKQGGTPDLWMHPSFRFAGRAMVR